MVNINCDCGEHLEPRRAWISVAQAAVLMGLSKRQATKRLARRDAELGGRLLRRIGLKRMPSGLQASKFLVSTEVFLQSMRPDQSNAERDIEALRIELVLTNEKLRALRKRLSSLSAQITT